jgi:hypothetical protein
VPHCWTALQLSAAVIAVVLGGTAALSFPEFWEFSITPRPAKYWVYGKFGSITVAGGEQPCVVVTVVGEGPIVVVLDKFHQLKLEQLNTLRDTYEMIVMVEDDNTITVVTVDKIVEKVVEGAVWTAGVTVETTIVVGTVVVGVDVVVLTTVKVDVGPGASQPQKPLTRLVAMLRMLASREVQSTVVAARL